MPVKTGTVNVCGLRFNIFVHTNGPVLLLYNRVRMKVIVINALCVEAILSEIQWW